MSYKLKSFIIILFMITTITATLQNQTATNTKTKLQAQTEPIIANHEIVNMIRLDQVPETAIIHAKETLHIAYAHTSHGSQIITGMNGLPAFKESKNGTVGLYKWHDGPENGSLDIDDYFVSGDLGNPDRITWANRTREYLQRPENADVNVVMWSWCGEVSTATSEDIDLYLSLMTELEEEFSSIIFVYMTGHTDGTGLTGNLHLRNEQIRAYVQAHNKVLFDFADIESYDPDGNYFGDKNVTDSCDYNGGNWAIEWQDSHPGEWYDCYSAHSQPLNANMKAYAAWWLFARLSGWNDITTTTTSNTETSSTSISTSISTSTLSSSTPTQETQSSQSNESTLPIALFLTVIATIITLVLPRKQTKK